MFSLLLSIYYIPGAMLGAGIPRMCLHLCHKEHIFEREGSCSTWTARTEVLGLETGAAQRRLQLAMSEAAQRDPRRQESFYLILKMTGQWAAGEGA